jgi:CubicO group peptidase (beta-lactamase class C family)
MKTPPARHLTNELARLMESTSFQGSILTAKHDRILTSQSYGYASIEHAVPNTPDTRYRIWSITKLFTATAILMLCESSRISLHQPVSQFFPEYPDLDSSITVHHLITHTSGLVNYTDIEGFGQRWSKLPMTPEEVLRLFMEKPLQFVPGSTCSYSNSGYYLLGLLIERASGMSCPEFIRERILVPAGMRHTGFDDNRTIIPSMASGYALLNHKPVKSEYMDIEAAFSAGAMYSTVHDLFLFDQAVFSGKLISLDWLRRAHTLFREPYGLGWKIGCCGSYRKVGHTGKFRGYRSAYWRYPDEDVTVIVLSNMDAPIEEVSDLLAELTFTR